MNYDTQTIQKVRNIIRFGLRQADFGAGFPKEFPITPAISALVDEATAQRLYDEIIAEWEKVSGRKIERYES